MIRPFCLEGITRTRDDFGMRLGGERDSGRVAGSFEQAPQDDFGDSPRDDLLVQLGAAPRCPPPRLEAAANQAQSLAVRNDGGSGCGDADQMPALMRHARAALVAVQQQQQPVEEWVPPQPTSSRSRKSAAKKSRKAAAARAKLSCLSTETPVAEGLVPQSPQGVAASSLGPAEVIANGIEAPSLGGEVETDGLPETWPAKTTTVMLRNIPNRYTSEQLLAELLANGFEGNGLDFDFFYLPIDFDSKRNRGYSFINFTDETLAKRFFYTFNLRRLTRYTTQKILEVSPAVTQGFDANVQQYARKDALRIKNSWFRPMIFTAGGEAGL